MRKVAVAFVLLKLAACATFDDAGPANGDAGAGDGSTNGEASTDGGAAACPTGAFCDGFERTDYQEGWSEQGKLADVKVRIDDAIAASGARSLRWDIATTTPEGPQYLTRGLDANARKVSVTFSARMTPNVNLTFLTIELGPLDPVFYDGVTLETGANGALMRENLNTADGGYQTNSTKVSTPPETRFGTYTFIVDLDAKSATFIDEGSKLETTMSFALPHQGFREIRLGVAYTGGDAGRPSNQTMWFDDVIIR